MFLKIVVMPGARKETVEEKGETLHISVREPAERNLANTRVRELIAAKLGKPVSSVRILTGHHSRVKMVSIK